MHNCTLQFSYTPSNLLMDVALTEVVLFKVALHVMRPATQARMTNGELMPNRHPAWCYRVMPYTNKPSHSCNAVCQRSRLWASEYSVKGVDVPVLKSTG